MDDIFAVKELRIRQPAKMLPGRARYDIFNPAKKLLAIANETEPRTALQAMASLVPRTRVIGVRDAAGQPLFTMVKRDADWLAELKEPGGELIGQIKIEETLRDFTLVDEAGEVAGKVAGDLSVKHFTITGPEGERYAQLNKTWAGLTKELLTSSDHYTIIFTGPMRPQVRLLVVMLPVVVDMQRHGPY